MVYQWNPNEKHETAQTQPGCWWRAAFELMPAKPVVAVQFAETAEFVRETKTR